MLDPLSDFLTDALPMFEEELLLSSGASSEPGSDADDSEGDEDEGNAPSAQPEHPLSIAQQQQQGQGHNSLPGPAADPPLIYPPAQQAQHAPGPMPGWLGNQGSGPLPKDLSHLTTPHPLLHMDHSLSPFAYMLSPPLPPPPPPPLADGGLIGAAIAAAAAQAAAASVVADADREPWMGDIPLTDLLLGGSQDEGVLAAALTYNTRARCVPML